MRKEHYDERIFYDYPGMIPLSEQMREKKERKEARNNLSLRPPFTRKLAPPKTT